MSPQRSRISLTTSGLITALSVSLTLAIAGPFVVSPPQSYEQCLRDGCSHAACWDKQTLPDRCVWPRPSVRTRCHGEGLVAA